MIPEPTTRPWRCDLEKNGRRCNEPSPDFAVLARPVGGSLATFFACCERHLFRLQRSLAAAGLHVVERTA